MNNEPDCGCGLGLRCSGGRTPAEHWCEGRNESRPWSRETCSVCSEQWLVRAVSEIHGRWGGHLGLPLEMLDILRKHRDGK
jgi:hypothetical protein